jgi:hypothetical protein
MFNQLSLFKAWQACVIIKSGTLASKQFLDHLIGLKPIHKNPGFARM